MMEKIEQYQCKSFVDDDSEVQDCTCGKCGYEHNLRRWKEAYIDVSKVCSKYSERFKRYASDFDDIHEMEVKAKNHLLLIEWYEKYGLKIDHGYRPYSNDYFRIDDYKFFSHYNDARQEKDSGKGGRYISWPDDDRQPKNEWLLEVGFSTGAYIFGEDYDSQKQLFQDFFKELQSYKPDYSDSHNHNLYWKLENAKPIYEEFNNILNKYRERNQSELKQRKADKLRKELAELED
jgi:hypothetical protein